MVPDLTAEVLAEVIAEILIGVLIEVATEVFIIQLNQGVGNFVYYYIVVQAGLGFDVDTGAILYLIVAGR